MQYIGYLAFRFIVFLFWLLPFSAMYRLSNGVAWLLRVVIGYRKKIVYKQLCDSFPDKSAAEIDRLARASYLNLSDILLESIKGFSMSEADFKERYVFPNPEIVHNSTEANGNSIQMAAHYANWEWGVISLPLWVKCRVVGFYKPLSNPYMNKYGLEKRGQFGFQPIPISETALGFERLADKPTAFFFVGDQSTNSDKAHWVTFLNQDTACPYGGDKYARKYDFPVYYLDTQRVKRGHYTVTFEKFAVDVPNLPDAEVTRRFMARLERIILAQPENWLWSHKRWKKKRVQQV